VWEETLVSLDERGLLDAIEYVDLCNEFPLDDWLPAAHEAIFGRPQDTLPSIPGQAVEGGWVWSAEQRERIRAYFAAVDGLRSRWPQLRFTVSVAPVSESVYDLDYRDLDLIETHVWLSSNVAEFAAVTNFSLDEHGFPGAWQKQVDSLDEVYWPDPERWHRRRAGRTSSSTTSPPLLAGTPGTTSGRSPSSPCRTLSRSAGRACARPTSRSRTSRRSGPTSRGTGR
jgi:hypothetical protein